MSNFLLKKLPLLFVVALSAVLWLPNLFTRGMFIDGLFYGMVAHNLAIGDGSWWVVHSVPTMGPELWGNPPFHIWMLSFFYSILGNHFWVDRFYSLITAIGTLILIFFCTKEIAIMEDKKNDKWWLACIAWLLFLPVSWSYSNNLMENTMTMFSTLSFLLLLKYIRRRKGLFLFAPASAACIFVALITKGLPALFPILAPICFINCKPSFTNGKAIAYSLIQFAVFVGLFLLVFSMQAPANFLHNYINVQLIPVLQQQYHNTGSRFFIVFELVKAIVLPLLLLVALMIFKRGKVAKPVVSRMAKGVLLLALLASLPIMISLKQSTFYLVPSLPLFALFFGDVLAPYIERVKVSLSLQKFISFLSIAALIVAIVFCIARFGVYNREADTQADLKKIASLLGNEKIVSTGHEIHTEYSMKVYLFRDYRVTDRAYTDSTGRLFLIKKIGADSIPPAYHPVYKGKLFELFKNSK